MLLLMYILQFLVTIPLCEIKLTWASYQRIILVGGFAESPYLFNALEEWCWKNGDIVLIRPVYPQVNTS